jgi:hypothetical protein
MIVLGVMILNYCLTVITVKDNKENLVLSVRNLKIAKSVKSVLNRFHCGIALSVKIVKTMKNVSNVKCVTIQKNVRSVVCVGIAETVPSV